MEGFLDYVPGSTPLHRLHPLVKMAAAFLLCVSCFLSENLLYVLGIVGLNLLMGYMAGIFRRSLKMLGSLLKFSLLLFVVQIFFVGEGRVLVALPFHLSITDRGLAFSLLFVLRLLAATMPLTLMLSLTQMNDLSNALVDSVGIPYKYTFALTTALRFIPLFASEMQGIMQAQMARGVEFDTRNFFKKVSLLLPLCVPLLLSSVRRVESEAIAVELRGFSCRQRGNGYKRHAWGCLDAVALLLVLAVGALGLWM